MNLAEASLVEKHGGDSSLQADPATDSSEEIGGAGGTDSIAGFAGIVGQSSALRQVLQQFDASKFPPN